MTEHPDTLIDLYQTWATPPEGLVGTLPRGGTTLSYLGHAAVTRALLEADPTWTWEPVAWNDNGTPLIGHQGSRLTMWIRLTVAGVTRYGVGTCPDNKGEPEKELIGDALRNAAMRFGVALSLWAKEEWHDVGASPGESRVSVDTTQPSPGLANSPVGSGDNTVLPLGADDGGPPDPDPLTGMGVQTATSFSGAVSAATARRHVKELIETLDDDQKARLRDWMQKKQWTLARADTVQLADIRAYCIAMIPPELGDY